MRKINRIFYFSVEGQTERQYLQWLQKTINADSSAQCKVKLEAKVEKNPVSYVKQLTSLERTTVTHVFDYESNDAEHQLQFRNTLDQMRKASQLGKSVKYKLGYSNYTFELWIILHKSNCNTPLSHRRQYLQAINRAYHTTFESLDEYKREENFGRILGMLSLDDVRQAIRRSEAIEAENQEHGYTLQQYKGFEFYKENPSLSIWRAIKNILSLCGLL